MLDNPSYYNDDDPSVASVDHTDDALILPEDLHLIYVHVGQTGGSSLNTVLRSNCEWFQNPRTTEQCYSNLGWMTKFDNGTIRRNDRTNEPLLSRLTRASVHMHVPTPPMEAELANATHFVVSVRNPLERVVSVFHADHPSNQDTYKDVKDKDLPKPLRDFYVECFPTIEELVRRMWTWTQKDSLSLAKAQQETCYQRGDRAFAGGESQYADSSPWGYNNYQFYGDISFLKYPAVKILVLRTESLWEDTKNLDLWLGGDGNLGVGKESVLETSGGSESFTVKSELTSEWTKKLCCLMAHEIQLYEDLIRHSLNLMDSEKAETLTVVYEQCGVTGNVLSETFDWDGWKVHQPDCIH
eukprot:Nitzschia sp. Nitz4//scaffold224_size33420//73//1137//NITZ4_007885-RA/size33420-processed-gene-0.34-mRNA-1//-1//CDS//3329542635//6314//frame0